MLGPKAVVAVTDENTGMAARERGHGLEVRSQTRGDLIGIDRAAEIAGTADWVWAR